MPYTQQQAKERLQKTYKNVSDTAARQFAKVWNSAYEKHKDEGKAFSIAYGVLKRRGLGRKSPPAPVAEASLGARARRRFSPIRRSVLAAVEDQHQHHTHAADAPPTDNEEAPEQEDPEQEQEEPPAAPAPAPAPKPLAQPMDYEAEAKSMSELMGGIPRIQSADALLIEDAGPGVNVHFSHHGEVMSLEPGSAHPTQLIKWLERVVDGFSAREAVKEIDLEKVAGDPKAFARFMEALFKSQKLGAASSGSKVSVGSMRDVVRAVQSLFGDRVRAGFQKYFKAPAPKDSIFGEPPSSRPNNPSEVQAP
jgi:hypothetical protein